MALARMSVPCRWPATRLEDRKRDSADIENESVIVPTVARAKTVLNVPEGRVCDEHHVA